MRDFGALHTRLVPGFVLDTKLDGEARIVRFANGSTRASGRLRRRAPAAVYAVHSERLKQHSASVQVVADADTHCHVVWIVDLLPHEAALYISRQIDEGAAFMQKAFMGGTV